MTTILEKVMSPWQQGHEVCPSDPGTYGEPSCALEMWDICRTMEQPEEDSKEGSQNPSGCQSEGDKGIRDLKCTKYKTRNSDCFQKQQTKH